MIEIPYNAFHTRVLVRIASEAQQRGRGKREIPIQSYKKSLWISLCALQHKF